MKVFYAVVISLFFLVCTNAQNKEISIPYTIANGYFVKNSFKEVLKNNKITSKEAFENIFGMATVMGKNGKPTFIDFKKNYVIAIVNPINNLSAQIIPIKLIRNNKSNLTLHFKIEEQEAQTYDSQASLIVIVNKKHKGKVNLEGYTVK